MRMSRWTPEIVRFMEDASAYTPYFDAMAAAVRRFAPSCERVCDAGCGMGQLSFALAPYAGHVDAVDRSARAVGYVRRQARERGAHAVRPIRADVASLRPEQPYDLMVFSLSASLDAALSLARPRCVGTLVVVNKVHDAAPDGTPRPHVHDFAHSLAGVNAAGIPCTGTELSLEFGQPFRSLADAARYCALFRTRDFPADPSRADLAALLDETGDDVFPYYLPVRRRLALFALDLAAVGEGRGPLSLTRPA